MPLVFVRDDPVYPQMLAGAHRATSVSVRVTAPRNRSLTPVTLAKSPMPPPYTKEDATHPEPVSASIGGAAVPIAAAAGWAAWHRAAIIRQERGETANPASSVPLI